MNTAFSFDIFLSHNVNDKQRVRNLAERLRAVGLRVWFDEWVIKPGDDIYLAVESGLEAARVLVLCLSEHALGSDWVRMERSTVLFRDPSNKGRRFIPLLLDDCQLPDSLRRFKYVDFRQEDEEAFEQLLAACHDNSENLLTDSIPMGQTIQKWVWFSTPTSFESSKISVLAIFETVLASLVYLFIVFEFGTAHITIAVLLAPILLLRTDESVKFALEHSKSYEKSAVKNKIWPNKKTQNIFVFEMLIGTIALILTISGVLGMPPLWYSEISGGFQYMFLMAFAGFFYGMYIYMKGIAIRIWATARCTLVNPYAALSNIPKNWWHQIVCLDTLHPPEVIPGAIEYEATKNYVSQLQPFSYLYAAIMLEPQFYPKKLTYFSMSRPALDATYDMAFIRF